MTLSNRDVAQQARELAQRTGGLTRRAGLCVSVAAGTTATIASARRALDAVEPRDVKAAALRMLDDLAGETEPS
jgi:hypothetical protein